MAPRKTKTPGKSAKYYNDNPKAKKKKDAYNKKFNQKPEQKAKRKELAKARRKRGIMGKGGGDLAHTSRGLVRKSVKANRGSKSDTAGDVRARGRKRIRKK